MSFNLAEGEDPNHPSWETAERRLCRNMVESTWAYPMFLAILTAGTNLAATTPLLLAAMWITTVSISICRYYWHATVAVGPIELRKFARKMRITSIVAAAQWGSFLVAVLLKGGNSSWEFLVVQLCLTGSTAAIMTAYAIDWRLLALLEVMMIGPATVTHLFTGNQGWVLALLYSCYLTYLLQQGKEQNSNYWKALDVLHQLEIHMLELEESQKVVLEANRLKSNFMTNMSHELRTPLNAIIGYSQILEEELRDRGQLDLLPDLGRIRFAGNLQLGMINQVLDLSKIETGRNDVNLEPQSLQIIMEYVVGESELLARKNGNQFFVDAPVEDVILTTDVMKLQQLVLNLINNAHKFTSKGEVRMKVSIEEFDSQNWFCCRIEDNGIGMSEDQLERIFQPFVQADDAPTTRKYEGSGLGLKISREFARLLGGEVEAKSTLGHGSTFTVRIPVIVEPASLQLVENPTATPLIS